MSECNFEVGQRVALIDDKRRGHEGLISRDEALPLGAIYPVKGRVYTVRKVFVTGSGIVGLLLVEIDNSVLRRKMGKTFEPGFSADRFRPVVERKTDITVFRSMLTPKKESVPA